MSHVTQEELDAYKRRHETPIDDVIAEERLILHAGTRSIPILLQIGRPTLNENMSGVCPVASWGLNGRIDIKGSTTFQALCLGIRFLETTLRDRVDGLGARVELDGEGDGPIDENDLFDEDGVLNPEIAAILPAFLKPRPEDFTSHGIISTMFGTSRLRSIDRPDDAE